MKLDTIQRLFSASSRFSACRLATAPKPNPFLVQALNSALVQRIFCKSYC